MFTFRIDDEVSLALPRPQADATPLFDLITNDRQALAQHFTWVPRIQTAAAEQAWLQQALFANASDQARHYVIHYCDEIAGMIAFTDLDAVNHSANIAFWLGAEYRGQKIMTRALAGMCALAFTDYPYHRLCIRTAVVNQAANRVAKHAGFTLEASCRDALLRQDGYQDANQYVRLKTD
ncbi:GNAT family N-acetyltransferase [Lacticaseibacillus sp. GG6-2]